MSEQHSTNDPAPQIPFVEGNITSFDLEITKLLVDFLENSQNDARRKYRDMQTIGDKIDLACFAWGENPDTFEKSIKLKSLQAMWILESTAMSDDTTSSRDYPMPVHNAYWNKVDKLLYEGFSNSLNETGYISPAYDDLAFDTTHPLCMINNHVITRFAGSATGMVHYTAMPLEAYANLAAQA